jgi:hypothetical protein
MTHRHLIIVTFCLIAAFLSLPSHASSRPMRADGPQQLCFNPDWYPIISIYDPYGIYDGNLDGLWDSSTNFFQPGTPVTTPGVICLPSTNFMVGSYPWGGDSSNPASQPVVNPNPQFSCPGPTCGAGPTNAALTATGAVMYEWLVNSTDTNPDLNPDAEVLIWTLPPSTMFPLGALELEFDNWCGTNASGVAASPTTMPSFTWNNNRYTYYGTCANFNGDDLMITTSGILVGYVDNLGTNVTHVTNTVAGWEVGYQTTTRIALSASTVPSGTCVYLQANVSQVPGTPKPVGLVTFYAGSTAVGVSKMDALGNAQVGTATLAPGTYSIEASFHRQDTGTANYGESSVSTHVTLTVTSAVQNVPCV